MSKHQENSVELQFANSEDQWRSNSCTFDIGFLQKVFSRCFIDLGASALLFDRLSGAFRGYACYVEGGAYFVSCDNSTTSSLVEAVKIPSIALVLDDYRSGPKRTVGWLKKKGYLVTPSLLKDSINADSYEDACYVNGN